MYRKVNNAKHRISKLKTKFVSIKTTLLIKVIDILTEKVTSTLLRLTSFQTLSVSHNKIVQLEKSVAQYIENKQRHHFSHRQY